MSFFPDNTNIVVAGAGCMGCGISLSFAFSGFKVSLVDSEERPEPEFSVLQADVALELDKELQFLQRLQLVNSAQAQQIANRVTVVARADAEEVASMRALLESVGKQTVNCAPSPGFIVPRIQALAMTEAARCVEEGVASAEDVDKAVRLGFGVRYAVLGLLEFIDWGGGDIVYYATQYLAGALDDKRFSVPDIIETNMRENRNGIRDGQGFYDYSERDVDAYRQERLGDFVKLLQHLSLLPEAK